MTRGRMTARIEDPESVRVTLTITLSLSDWRDVRKRFEGMSFPDWWLRRKLDEVFRRVEHNVDTPLPGGSERE